MLLNIYLLTYLNEVSSLVVFWTTCSTMSS